MVSRRLVIALALLSVLALPPLARAADFAYGLEGVPERITGSPGEIKTFDVFVTLTTTNNESRDGAQGWSVHLKIQGGGFKLSFKGIEVSTIYDEDADFDPATPSIHHDPYLFDLGGSFTDILSPRNHIGPCAMMAVVMKSQEKMVLQPTGTQRIGKLTVEAEIPTTGKCAPLSIHFERIHPEDFCIGADLTMGDNIVVWMGQSQSPELGSATVLRCPTLFRRGDSNSDSLVDISDAIHLLASLFLGGPLPGCRDGADVNDDSAIDLSDPVFLLGDLFRPEFVTGLPAPGPYACGADPTADDLGCERSPCLAQ